MRIFPALITFLFMVACSHNPDDELEVISSHDINIAYIYKKEGKEGLLDTNKNVLIPAQFDHIESYQKEGLIRVDSGGKAMEGGCVVGYTFNKYGLISINGKIILRPQFDELAVEPTVLRIKQNGLYGYMDHAGKWIVKPKYTEAHFFYGGTVVVKENDRYMLIDTLGKQVNNQTFDSIGYIKNGVAVIEQNKQWGFINYRGDIICPLDNYRGIGDYNYYHGKIMKADQLWYLIDTAGKMPFTNGFQEVDLQSAGNNLYAEGIQLGQKVKIKLNK